MMFGGETLTEHCKTTKYPHIFQLSVAQRTVEIATLRVKVTDANVDYVGSVTVDSVLCDHLGLKDRQLVQIRNETSGVDLWTYIIYGRRSSSVPPGTLCLNGAAAHLVTIGDVVNLTAWANIPLGVIPPKPKLWDATQDGFQPTKGNFPKVWTSMVMVDIAIGKIHRPRISEIVCDKDIDHDASIAIDRKWLEEAGLVEGQSVHVVNISTGQRDIMPLKAAGDEQCILIMKNSGAFNLTKYGSRAGYSVGDIIIVMAYASVPYEALCTGSVPTMRIAFPVEKMVEPSEEASKTNWHYTSRLFWDEPKLARGLTKLLDLKRPGLRVLDCSCGNAFPGLYLAKAGIKLKMCDGSKLVSMLAGERLDQELGPNHEIDVRCVHQQDLANEYGKHAFDVIIWRGSSLPYVGGECGAPLSSDASSAVMGYHSLHAAAKGIFEALAPGGKLYVDCVPMSNDKGAVIKKEGVVPGSNGAKVQLEWEFFIDEETRARKWSSRTLLREDGQETREMNANLTALLVREQEVRSVLSYVGFGLVQQTICEGEDVYQPFVCDKPAAEKGHSGRQVVRYRRIWNQNGKILWGLFDKVSPFVMSPEIVQMSRTAGKGALVGPNLALQAFMVSKLDSINVERILNVGCGTGRAAQDLGIHFSNSVCLSCETSLANIEEGQALALSHGVSDRVSFFHGTAQDLVASDAAKAGSFSAAWSEVALCHLPQLDRVGAIQAIAELLQKGGVFVLNDAVAGHAPVSAAAQLHFYERLRYEGLWTKREYIDVLETCGLEVVEFVDLSQHQAASYRALAEEARLAARSVTDDEEATQAYQTLATDYDISAAAGQRGELGWNLFVCRKVSSLQI